ncbi:MAG TPA: ABC-type transport auxiliary lipoprotein family protein [Candidatus Solibacter sp.]|nr:ABC-type transport auxiliary lipoprotein family protein [Candidatus Solibacter sp.]
MIRANYELMMSHTESPRNGCERRIFRTRAVVSICLLALTVSLAAGCGAARPNHYYQLTIPGSLAPAANPDAVPITLLIGRMTGPAIYREGQIVYSSGGESMGLYEYHRWVEPPTEMIQEILLRQLRASGRYRGVYTLRSDIHGDYLLHGRIYDFKEISGSAIASRVTMELELREIKSHTVVWTHFYTHDEAVAGKGIDAVVEALDKNVQQGVTEMLASLSEYFAAHPPAAAAQTAK